MEEIAESLGRMLLRIIKWIVIEAVIETVVYWYGRIALLVFTFGKYPARDDDADTACIASGFFAIIATVAIIVWLQ